MVIRELLKSLSREIGENGAFEAACLLEYAGYPRIIQLTEPEIELPDEKLAEITALAERRKNGEPLQYILGEWEFYGFPFAVGRGVLIPRQDTETLVEVAEEFLKSCGPENRTAADLCAGSGCVGISLARRCGCNVSCIELSEEAFAYLEKNIERNGVSPHVSAINADIFSEQVIASLPPLDLIASNPPYLTESDMRELQKEVTYEPSLALFGGSDGLEFYRGITERWAGKLKPGGMLAVEIGMGQETDVMALFKQTGLTAECRKDACGINRVVYGIKQ